jgi:hypothetical protein
MFNRVVVVALLILQQCLSFHYSGLHGKQVSRSHPYKSKIKFDDNNVRMNAAIPLRGMSIGNKLYRSTFTVRKQLSLVTTAWKAAIFVCVAIVGRFKSKIGRAVGNMEGGWTKRGYNGAFWRTVEVWRFVFFFIFRYVSNHQ